MKRNKKGFTIVELVIVIAVIAILAAVLIPTFSSLINKAKESSDTALVKNLNIIMAADEAENGKSETMSEALAAAESAGYTIEKITPTSSGDILWDEQNNRFVLKKADGTYYAENGNVTEGVNLWKITDDLEEVKENSNHYSYYLKGTEITGAVTAKAGVDVGENSADVNYANDGAGQTVTIRMNGGKLTVNAPNDTVNSYGEKESVDITAVASASYHENGKVVGNIEVKKGRVELGAGAEVNTVLVSSAATGDVKVDVLAGAKVGSVAPTTKEAKEDIKLSTSIPADSRVEEIVGEEAKSFAGGIGTQASPYIISNIEQWKNLSGMCTSSDATKDKYFVVTSDLDFSSVNEKADCSYFAGNIDFGGYKVTGLSLTHANYKFSSAYGGLFATLADGAKVSNLKFYLQNLGNDISMRLAVYAYGTVVIDNVETYGEVQYSDNNASVLVFRVGSDHNGKSYGSTNLTVSNCRNYCKLQNTNSSAGLTGVFVGRNMGNDETFNFNNCINYAQIFNINAAESVTPNTSILLSNICEPNAKVYATGCENKGELYFTKDDFTATLICKRDNQKVTNIDELDNSVNTTLSANKIQTGNITVAEDGTISITPPDTAVKFEIVITYTTRDAAGGTEGIFINDLTIDQVQQFKTGKFLLASDVADGFPTDLTSKTQFTWTYNTCIIDGTEYIVLGDSAEYLPKKAPALAVNAYDADGKLVAVYIA